MSPPKKGITPLFERLSMSVYVEYEDGKPDYSLMGNPTTIKAVGWLIVTVSVLATLLVSILFLGIMENFREIEAN